MKWHIHMNAKEMALVLEADNLKMMRWCVNASFTVHDCMCGHRGGTMTVGKGSVHSKSVKQKSMERVELCLSLDHGRRSVPV